MKPCPALWETPTINWNGDVTVCCPDIFFKLKVGNINEKPLKELWNSDKLNEIRIKHIKKEYVAPCKDCPGTEPDNKKEFIADLISWLIEIGRPELIKEVLQ